MWRMCRSTQHATSQNHKWNRFMFTKLTSTETSAAEIKLTKHELKDGSKRKGCIFWIRGIENVTIFLHLNQFDNLSSYSIKSKLKDTSDVHTKGSTKIQTSCLSVFALVLLCHEHNAEKHMKAQANSFWITVCHERVLGILYCNPPVKRKDLMLCQEVREWELLSLF